MTVVGISDVQRRSATTFSIHVADILKVGRQPQMVRANTMSDVTGMRDFKAGRYRANAQLVDETVRAHVALVEFEITIPLDLELPSPKPATIGLLYLAPETVCYWPKLTLTRAGA